MKLSDISPLRLRCQHLSSAPLNEPVEVVRWLTAVQSQDYYGAKWALGLRLQDAIETDLDDAFNSGAILRTHVLRPTWHFVTPEDIRWLLQLTAPRVHTRCGTGYRQLDLDEKMRKKNWNKLKLTTKPTGFRQTRPLKSTTPLVPLSSPFLMNMASATKIAVPSPATPSVPGLATWAMP
jgi:hypothetical protein